MSVNKRRVRMLVNALLSGEFKQGRGLLKQQAGKRELYYCLGVACEVYNKWAKRNGKRQLKLTADPDSEGKECYLYNGHSSVLPYEVQRWFGFDSNDPVFESKFLEEITATTLNDDKKYNFKRIAKAFENTFIKGVTWNKR